MRIVLVEGLVVNIGAYGQTDTSYPTIKKWRGKQLPKSATGHKSILLLNGALYLVSVDVLG